MPFLRLPSYVVVQPDLQLRRMCRFVASVVVPVVNPRPFRHQGLSVVDHCFHNNILDSGQKRPPLIHASLPAEGFSIVTSRLPHHMKHLPVPAEEAEGTGTHTTYLQDIQAPVLVQGVVHLVQFQEYCVKDLLPHGHNLLKQLFWAYHGEYKNYSGITGSKTT